MLKRLHPFLAYIHYFLKKEDRHSLQSPFAFSLYEGLISFAKKTDDHLLKLRKDLLGNQKKITIRDFGTGSIHLKNPVRKIADITRHSSSPTKFSQLYQYFCSQTPAQTVLELGTCVGITTCYLAKATQGQLFTFEGAGELAEVARQTFRTYPNVSLIEEQIEKTLPVFLANKHKLDFVLIDAHHAYGATLDFWQLLLPYLSEQSIVAIGDIHRSPGMEKAWKEIKNHPEVTMTMDFFECGILFFKKGLKKQHYTLHY
ncbi:hypothetical protein GCM10028791_10610 [Echinicola sediminis]